ncbi:unnamed protein product [Rhizophagus irregularis]|uniref:Uncharacterized protein n=1 Tax=Rhizophagus irregularis TaxID=588596 RepID=A0A2I1FWD8_9GLOM|nr:hypothetical protein RhiirA4_451752 [Rhizophagus irregularis]CAB4408404.1 unnamed protein product [Rhizophagus irregularis]
MLFVSQVFELIESLDDDEAKAKIKEQFNFLKQTVDTKLKLFEESIENMSLDPSTPDKLIFRDRRSFFNVDQGVDKSIKDAIDILFPTDQNDGKKKLKTVDVCKELISAGIDSLFRNNVIGESEQAFDYILLQNNALVRIDIRIWYYKFSSSGVLSNVESAFCYVFSKSILDRNKLSNDELTYYFSEFAENCGNSVDDTIKRISDIYNSASSCKTDDKKILNSKLIDDKPISNGDDVQEEKEESKINS